MERPNEKCRGKKEMAMTTDPTIHLTGFIVLVTVLGIDLEEKRNAANEGVISANASRVSVRVIHTTKNR